MKSPKLAIQITAIRELLHHHIAQMKQQALLVNSVLNLGHLRQIRQVESFDLTENIRQVNYGKHIPIS